MSTESLAASTIRASLICVPSILAAAENASILFIQNVNGHLRHSPALMRDLHEQGFDVQFIQSWNKPDRGRLFERLIPKANVVVMVGVAKAMADGSVHPVDRAYFDQLKEFVRHGGGLFYLHGERYADAVAGWVHFVREWGLSGSVERVYGTDYKRRTVWGVSYSYTDRIEPSPVTEGVRGLWVPIYDERPMFRRSSHGELSGYYPCQALAFDDPAWQVLIRGSDACHSVPVGRDAQMDVIRQYARGRGTDKAPPLFGVRGFGKGRVAFSGISEAYFVGYASVAALEGVTWTEGVGDRPSDGRRLFLNTLRWLAEPSMQIRGKGGLEHDVKLEVSKDLPEVYPPIDWSTELVLVGQRHNRGVAGRGQGGRAGLPRLLGDLRGSHAAGVGGTQARLPQAQRRVHLARAGVHERELHRHEELLHQPRPPIPQEEHAATRWQGVGRWLTVCQLQATRPAQPAPTDVRVEPVRGEGGARVLRLHQPTRPPQ